MKAMAITALVFAALSILIPVGGVFIAMLCSVLAWLSFRSQPTLSGITFGINIINTAFLSPSLVMSDMLASNPRPAPRCWPAAGSTLQEIRTSST